MCSRETVFRSFKMFLSQRLGETFKNFPQTFWHNVINFIPRSRAMLFLWLRRAHGRSSLLGEFRTADLCTTSIMIHYLLRMRRK